MTYANAGILDGGKKAVLVQLSFAILEELTEREQRCTLPEELCDYASSTEDIHSLRHMAILLPISVSHG
jgi:hypothetical protein